MFDTENLKRLDFRMLPILITIMATSLFVISISTSNDGSFWTPLVKSQMRSFGLGILVYLMLACFDYRKLREWTWGLYLLTIILLIGLFFTSSIQNVHRWYRIPGLPFALQPSEFAKIVVVIALSWFLEKRSKITTMVAMQAGLIAFVPFVLILKQPDLGTALVLFPITLGMFYFGGIPKWILGTLSGAGIAGIAVVFALFSGMVEHEEVRPYATLVMKDYQFERLNPNTYHQRAGQSAIALGGLFGGKSEFTRGGWLPFAHTDSVFCVVSEEFGLVGAFLVLLLYFALVYFSFQVTAVAKEPFGRLLSAGIAVYLSMHIIVNIGMMCGFLPITGVPLVLMTCGGSSVLATLAALGILQSIYSRRYYY